MNGNGRLFAGRAEYQKGQTGADRGAADQGQIAGAQKSDYQAGERADAHSHDYHHDSFRHGCDLSLIVARPDTGREWEYERLQAHESSAG